MMKSIMLNNSKVPVGFALFNVPDKTRIAVETVLPEDFRKVETDQEDTERWINESDNGQLFIGYRNPLLDLATRLEDSGFDERAVRDWMDDAARLVALAKSDRRRVALLDVDAMIAAPDAFSGVVSDRCGTEVKVSPPRSGPDRDETCPGKLSLLAAAFALHQDDACQYVLSEIQASSLPMPDPSAPSLKTVLSEAAKLDKSSRNFSGREAREELMLFQVRQVQQALEAEFRKSRNLESQLHQTRAETGAHIHHLTGELHNHQAALVEKTAALETRENDLQAVLASLSWKITAPLRAVLGLFVNRR